MKTKIVQFDSETLPPLTDEQVQRLRVLASRPESEIDYSDIPPLDVNTATKVHRGRFYSPPQRQITAEVDAELRSGSKRRERASNRA